MMDAMNNATFYPADGGEPMMPAVQFEGKDPDTIKYLLLLKIAEPTNGDEEAYSWHVSVGRQATYDYLKDLVTKVALDTDLSFVMAEGVKEFSAVLNVRRFMITMRNEGKVTDFDDWNIDGYRLDPTYEEIPVNLADCTCDHSIDLKFAV